MLPVGEGRGVSARPAVVSEEALAGLVGLVREETGNVVPRGRFGFLEEIAARRARARGFPRAEEYVRELAAGRLDGEWEQLIPLITVKESYFFRAPQQFAAIERHVLPRILRAKGAARTLRIWSAAAARGEEAATLAMILAEHQGLATWDWTIVATDLDVEALAAAERGLYGERAIAQVPPRLLERWFTRRGSLYELHPGIRGRIEYLPLNLAHPPFRAVSPGGFDLILLRNVLIYFRRPLQRRVVAEVCQRLEPEGYLFLGASETLWQIFDQLAPVELDACFAYRHRERVEEAAPQPPRPPVQPLPAATSGCVGPLSPDRAPKALGRRIDSNDAESARRDAPHRLTAQDHLLEAARHLAANRLEEAVGRVAEARAADPSEPAVYALEGFVHDLAARPEAAATAYRAALYLDPGLFQVRVLLADCLRRLGRRERADHELRQVLATLDRGAARELVLLEGLPFPSRQRAARHCRRALGGR
jgi:chemotaxis protein methyltransferase CheR